MADVQRTRLWTHPDPVSTEMWRFLQHVNHEYSLQLADYASLYKWSVDNVAEFWKEVWRFVGIKASAEAAEVRHIALQSLASQACTAMNASLTYLWLICYSSRLGKCIILQSTSS